MLCALPVLAQARTTCDVLAANLRQDVLIQGSAASQLAEHRRAICAEENKSRGSSYDRFCPLDEGRVASGARASLEVRKASAAAYERDRPLRGGVCEPGRDLRRARGGGPP